MRIPSVIDLTLTTQGLVDKVENWQTLLVGSDYTGILFTILLNSSNNSSKKLPLRYNIKKAN